MMVRQAQIITVASWGMGTCCYTAASVILTEQKDLGIISGHRGTVLNLSYSFVTFLTQNTSRIFCAFKTTRACTGAKKQGFSTVEFVLN